MLQSCATGALTFSPCNSIGPATVLLDRADYGSSGGNSWKEQTLLNIVKFRYADMRISLEVAQVGYQLQSAIGGSFFWWELQRIHDWPLYGKWHRDGVR